MGGWRNDWMDGNAVLWIANGNKKLKSLKNEKIISVSIIKLDRPYIFWVYFAISPSNFKTCFIERSFFIILQEKLFDNDYKLAW